jgi:hypothetical protein
LFGAVLIWPRVANSIVWRATITPLASIIGSGFLVLGPILGVSYGGYKTNSLTWRFESILITISPR